MKLQFAIVLGAILVGSIATVNMVFVSESDIAPNSLKSSAGMLGHLTLTATDEEGNIIAYRQTDNVVINAADECIADELFDAGLSSCNESNLYDDVHIGTSTTAFGETGTGLGGWVETTAGSVTSTSAASATGGASVTVEAAFVNVGQTIAEAALRNGAGSGATSDVLALQDFSAIALGANDDLTIQWTVTIDGN